MRSLKAFALSHKEISLAILSIISASALMCACLLPYRALMQKPIEEDPFSPRALSLVCPVGITYELECDLLARFISHTAEDEPYICRVAIGAVVCNRMCDAHFADDLASVLASFSPYFDKEAFLREPSKRSMDAARDAILGIDPSGGALYFFDKNIGLSASEAARVTVSYGSFSFSR